MTKLPIDPLLPSVCERLEKSRRLLLIASPGSGKTTRVPWALSKYTKKNECGRIYVLEPRRLAAKLSAERVAKENGVLLGGEVGYQFRFERKRSDTTRVVFLTEGTFLRELQENPDLKGVGTLILDEFHERHLQADLALAIGKRLQETSRPELKILVMSATLDPQRLLEFLPGADLVELDAPRFPISIEYQAPTAQLELHVRRVVEDLLAREDAATFGDLLVFLPGISEIRRVERALRDSGSPALKKAEISMLHGMLAREEQDRALSPSGRRKIILSTNVAESSVTIPGVGTVVDSGWARIASFSHASGLPRLETKAISKASAIQRAGRAGRTGPGRVVRLYSRGDFEGRASQETPEILRSDMAPILLDLGTFTSEVSDFVFFEKPSEERIAAGWEQLDILGFAEGKKLTSLGRRAAESPFHPRITRCLIEAARLDAIDEVVPALVALSEEEDLGEDFLEGLKRFRLEGMSSRISVQVSTRMRETARSLSRQQEWKSLEESDPSARIARAILAGFHDRIGRRKGDVLLLARGGSASCSKGNYWHHSEYHLVLDLSENRREGERRARTSARSGIAIAEEWLWQVEPLPVRAENARVFDEAGKRWRELESLFLHQLELSKTWKEVDPSSTGECSESEWDGLFQKWLEAFRRGLGERDLEFSPRLPQRTDLEAWTSLKIRYRLLQGFLEGDPGVKAPDFETLLRSLLFESYRGARSTRDFPDLDTLLGGLWSASASRAFREATPSFAALPGRKKTPVLYEDGVPTRIESRMQDFFGLSEGPRILGGSLRLSLHLLAPNYRAVQITEDLKGFWERHYAGIRKELMRQYPRHFWPENPLIPGPAPLKNVRQRR